MLADEKGLPPLFDTLAIGIVKSKESRENPRVNIGIAAICIPGLITRGAPAVCGGILFLR